MTSIFSIASVANPSSHGDHGVVSTMTNRHLAEENNKLKEQVAEGKRKIQTLAKKLSAANADVARSVQSVAVYDTLEGKYNQCIKERNEARSELAKAHQEEQDLCWMVAKLQEQMTQMEKTHSLQMETSREKSEALKDLLESVSAQASELTASKEAVESELKATQSKAQTLQDNLTESKNTQRKLLEDVKQLSAEKVEMSKKISILGANIQANEQHRKQMEAKSATLAYERNTLSRELNKANMEYKKLFATKQSLATTAGERSQTIEAMRKSIQAKDSENVRVVSELDMVSHSHDMALLEIDALKKALNDTVKTLEKKEVEAKTTQEQLESEIMKLSEQKGSLDMELESSRQEVSSLKDCVADREEKIKQEQEKLAALGCSEKIQVLSGVGKISFTESHF
ncbi:expressed unknown protein [Seminavis robusta]|uniref:Uncharacterized protein n=1 Tax=Seminavis robusta TaxID=568900 RepID=A0A9N8HF34_9STRA|nr:expressed unknown protein [Seminavis robusta]|eukprot:Sro438_g142980.1 n/a (400) ;mRNA; f:18277-19476